MDLIDGRRRTLYIIIILNIIIEKSNNSQVNIYFSSFDDIDTDNEMLESVINFH